MASAEPDPKISASPGQEEVPALLAALRHELRTPLKTILGCSEMVRRDAQTLDEVDIREAITADLEKIHTAAVQLLTLAKRILDPVIINTDSQDIDLDDLGVQLCNQLRDPMNLVVSHSAMLVEDARTWGLTAFIPDLEVIHAAGQQFLSFVAGMVDLACIEITPVEGEAAAADANFREVIQALRTSEAVTPGHLLVIDDVGTNRDILTRRLERQGYTVTAAANGPEALELVTSQPFDLILLEIRMPGMDGFAVCERLKGDPRTHDIPIIFISALAEIQDKIQGFAVGGVDYITKPFQFPEVLARVETHLALRRLQTELEATNRKLQEANAKMAAELTLAGDVQAGFLPHTIPELPGWESAVALKPSRETSGDFYDMLALPNGSLGIVIADVVDKGAGAALFMALTSTLIRTYAVEKPDQPAEVLSAVNRRILEETSANQFATAFYGVLDPGTGTLVYCNAGHNPPYLIHSPEAIQALPNTGMPLGLYADVRWEQQRIQVAPGDLLVLYTDGITEAQNLREEFFGKARMLEVLEEHLEEPAEAVQEALIGAVYDFTDGAPQSDDITLVILKREKAGGIS